MNTKKKPSTTNKFVKRVRQRAKLLVARPDFQEDVHLLRDKWNIPGKGFKNDNESEQWHNEFYQSDDDYFENVWLKQKSKVIMFEKDGNHIEAESLKKKLNNDSPINAFRIDIKNLIKEYKLPLRWENSIRRYLFFNDKDKMWLPVGLSVKEERDKDTGLPRLYVEIEDNTTQEMIKKYWSIIKHRRNKLNSYTKKKYQPIKMYERDKMAYDLKREGKKLKEIAKLLSKEYKKVYEWNDVSKFIERHREKLGMN